MKVLIIGGVAGGATAAARLRRLSEDAEIVILERSGFVSYANCGLPYYLGGEITDREELTVQTPESLRRRFRIDVRVREEALSINVREKTVAVRRLADGGEYTESYDKLILSPGAHSTVPPLPGVEDEGIFTLRTVEDTFRIHDFLEKKKPRTAVIIGGGFIGLEMAENLMRRGLAVTVVQRSGHVMPTLDQDTAAVLHGYARKKGLGLRLNAAVTGFSRSGYKILTELRNEPPLAADMVLLSVGVTPESALARAAGLELGLRGSIRTDDHMRTSEEDIYAVGDAVEVTHFVTGQPAVISLAGPANRQGRIAADNICGIPSTYKGSQGSSVMKLFDMTVATTGLNEKQASAAGLDFDYVILSSASHAGYYPGAASMTVKVLFEKPDGRILGAQLVGFGGVDKRIDVLATAIRAGMTAFDLTELDLAYAPPYSSAKDPVNMAGYAMENLLRGLVRQCHWGELPPDAALLDTRTPGEYRRGHIEGALHIPLDELRSRTDELPRDRTLYVYCQSGLRSYLACRILTQLGFDCRNVSGGYGFYAASALDKAMEREGLPPCGLKKEK